MKTTIAAVFPAFMCIRGYRGNVAFVALANKLNK